MNIFEAAILITLSNSDPFIALSTLDEKHGRSQRFLLRKETLENMLYDDVEDTITETDLLNVCSVRRASNSVHFTMYWLHGNYNDDLCGYRQTFTVPVDKAALVLSGTTVKHLYHPVWSKARLTLTDTAHWVVTDTATDKLKRHAIRRFFRDNFNYGREEHIIVQRNSWIGGFYFRSDVSRIDGGIVLHDAKVKGKDGKVYTKLYFGIHT